MVEALRPWPSSSRHGEWIRPVAMTKPLSTYASRALAQLGVESRTQAVLLAYDSTCTGPVGRNPVRALFVPPGGDRAPSAPAEFMVRPHRPRSPRAEDSEIP
ncbi:hypothetical protein QZH56_02610 [Streptomyces olivoreticuli]|uniref:hypothetical protein n=1 Tax=Streptomyces olivoreticuli TaxID=68246 RepID=UPI00265A59F9|nr:hypothetical protein [Streptomyces olivoreticuli]WKK24561.1 hypothetical protein QZH56_02610 [Streptomyces olivoreticuli]